KNQRPNVGCRELIRLNASKILPGILNDISDWVEATRIKSIQLLYIMIWQAEKNTTQHLETALQTLFKASNENVHIIQDYIFNCSRLIGVFTDADLCLPVAFKTVKKLNSINSGAINLLNGLLVGCGIDKITPNLGLECLELLEDICKTYDNKLNQKALNCCATIAQLIQKENSEPDSEKKNKLEYILFKVLSTISALAEEEELKMKAKEVVKNINETKIQSLTAKFLNELKCNCESWTDNAFEPNIFCFLLKEQEVSEKILQDIMTILKKCLNPSKDVKMRTKFLLMIPEVFSSICKSSDKTILETCLEDILNEMIIPNIVWKAGRSAGALRMTACASLVLLMKSEAIKTINLSDQSIDKLLKMMLSSLDDDNKSTRLYVSRVFIIILNNYGKSLEKDQLHKFYPEFIKRLDDQSEEIRVEILKIFYLYFSCLNQNYDKILYQAHLQVIYENLLLYLDDTNEDFQLKILDILKHGSILNPELLIQEIKKVKEKHRNKKLCEDLEMCCQKNIETNF
ncbi:dynein assembly factor axonemal-like, partial [Brachionus plicatilis]